MIIYFLLSIGKLQEFLKQRFKIFAFACLETKLLHRILERMSSGSRSQDQLHAVSANFLRRHNFVNLFILKQSILMDAGRVREGILTRNCLIHLNIQARQMRQQPGGSNQLLEPDIGGGLKMILPDFESHDHFFKRRIACALPKPLIVHSTFSAPFLTALSVLAVASPRSLWQ